VADVGDGSSADCLFLQGFDALLVTIATSVRGAQSHRQVTVARCEQVPSKQAHAEQRTLIVGLPDLPGHFCTSPPFRRFLRRVLLVIVRA
jgi:hypothetical protein